MQELDSMELESPPVDIKTIFAISNRNKLKKKGKKKPEAEA